MYQLNLPEYQFKIKKEEKKFFIFDSQRKRYVALTPEEWVRQNFIRFLIEEMNYPAAYLAIEYQIEMNGMKKRCDAVLFTPEGEPFLIIELKSPEVNITQSIFDQVAVYNSKLNVEFFMVSNGIEHYCCKVNTLNNRYHFFPSLPVYPDLIEKKNIQEDNA